MNGQEQLLDAIDAATEPTTEYERGWRDGYAQAVLEVKAAEHGIVNVLSAAAELERRRWRLFGEQRTRATFGDPHPDDYPGKGAA